MPVANGGPPVANVTMACATSSGLPQRFMGTPPARITCTDVVWLLDYVTDFSGAVNCRSARLRRKFADAEGGADAIFYLAIGRKKR